MTTKKFPICISFPSNDRLEVSLEYKDENENKNKIIAVFNILKINYNNNEKFKKFKELYYYLNTINDDELEISVINDNIKIEKISDLSFEKIKAETNKYINKQKLIDYINKQIKDNNKTLGGRFTKCNKNNNKRRKTRRLMSKI